MKRGRKVEKIIIIKEIMEERLFEEILNLGGLPPSPPLFVYHCPCIAARDQRIFNKKISGGFGISKSLHKPQPKFEVFSFTVDCRDIRCSARNKCS
jgi:hypothetical protein